MKKYVNFTKKLVHIRMFLYAKISMVTNMGKQNKEEN